MRNNKFKMILLIAFLVAGLSVAAKVQLPNLSVSQSLADEDKFYFVDFSDKTDGANGSGRGINWSDLNYHMPFDWKITYNAKKYGVKGDGITLFDGAITSGTDDFTSATATFTSADVGKVITISNAGGTNTDLTTTIAAFVDAHSVTLTANATATVTGAAYTYGTDDTTAINAIITTIAALSNPQGEIFFPAGTYIVNGAFNKANNSQIGLPTISSTSNTPRNHTIIKLKGQLYGKSTNPQRYATGGSIIYSTRQGVAGDSIISGKAVGSSGSLTDVRIEIDTMTFRTVQNPVNSALNLEFLNSAIGSNIYIEAGTVLLDGAQPTTSTSTGLITPGVLNNSISYWRDIRVQGFYNGIKAQEHAQFDNTFILLAVNGLVITSNGHTVYGNYVGVERTINNLVCSGTAASILIHDLDVEHNGSGLWYDTVTDIKDVGNNCTGRVNYFIQGTGGGGSTLLKSGAQKIDTVDLRYSNDPKKLKQGSTISGWQFENTGTANGTSSGANIALIQNNATAVTAGTRLGCVNFSGVYNTTDSSIVGSQFCSRSIETFTSTAAGSYAYIATTPAGGSSPTEKIRIQADGNVGIGTSAPSKTLCVGSTCQASIDSSGIVQPAGYKSSDGSAGVTGATCTAWKNGLCTSL